MRTSITVRLLLCCLLSMAADLAGAQGQEYHYVKFSLGVPWALYFVFLLFVTIPFVVMITLAWRRRDEPADSTSEQPQASEAPLAASQPAAAERKSS